MNLVFDFGAVLVEWQPARLLQTYFPKSADTPEGFGQLAQDFFHHADWQSFDRGTLGLAEVARRTAARLELPPLQVQGLMEGIGDLLTAKPDTLAVLEDLHLQRAHKKSAHKQPLRLYYLSNMPVPFARTLEKNHAFLSWFDGGIFSGDVQHIKPEASIYQLLQSRYQLAPAQTLFIDDMPVNVQAARACGWTGIHFESAAQLATELRLHGF
jgi:putative hydrolase of the HAD superfamily